MKNRRVLGIVVFFLLLATVSGGCMATSQFLSRFRCMPWTEMDLPGLMPDRQYLFVAMGVCDTVIAIDTETGSVAASASVDGKFPHSLAVTLDGEELYVANQRSDDIAVFSLPELQRIASISSGNFPTDLVPSRDGRKMFVANFKEGSLQVIHRESGMISHTVERQHATHFAVAPGGRKLFLTQWDEDQLTALDGQGNKVINVISMPGRPFHATVSQDDRSVYVTLYEANAVAVVDARRLEVITTIPVERRPMAPVVSPDGRWIYVSYVDRDRISIIDAEQLKVVGEIVTGGTPQHMAMGRQGRFLYVSNPERESVQVIDLRKRQVAREITTGPQPQQLAPRYFAR